jgi:hypothetical protein
VTGPDGTIVVPEAGDAAIGLELPAITDDYMRSRLPQAQGYTLALLRTTPKYSRPAADQIVWEHGRRNMALQQSGLMPIVCPVRDDSDLAGLGIFTVRPERVEEILREDPGVKAGIFSFEVHPIVGFPGSSLPEESHVVAQAMSPRGSEG